MTLHDSEFGLSSVRRAGQYHGSHGKGRDELPERDRSRFVQVDRRKAHLVEHAGERGRTNSLQSTPEFQDKDGYGKRSLESFFVSLKALNLFGC